MNETNAPEAALEVIDLHKRFGNIDVLKGVSLSAHTGNVISIIGSSGSGKSTLLRCINLLESPNAGRIRFDGEELADIACGASAQFHQTTEGDGLRFERNVVASQLLDQSLFPMFDALARGRSTADAQKMRWVLLTTHSPLLGL